MRLSDNSIELSDSLNIFLKPRKKPSDTYTINGVYSSGDVGGAQNDVQAHRLFYFSP